MKTFSNNIRLIEGYLSGTISKAGRLFFETQLLVNSNLRHDLHFQRKTIRLVKMYHRKKFKEELEELHQEIFQDPKNTAFINRMLNLFNYKL